MISALDRHSRRFGRSKNGEKKYHTVGTISKI
jgi:hypothetical protein